METSFESADKSPGFLLWQVSNLWQRRQRLALAPLDLTHAQFVLLASLAWLNRSGKPVTQIQLAQHAQMDVMMVSDVTRTLEKKALIQRSPHPDDARAKCVTLTASGQAKMSLALKVVEGVDLAFFSDLPDGSTHLISLLQQLLKVQQERA